MPDQEVPVESFQTDREYGQVRYGTQLFFNEMPLFLSVRTKSNGQMCVRVCHISIFQRRNGSTGKYRQKHQVDETSITRTNIQFCWVRNAGKNETFLKKKKGMECTVTKRPLISEPSRDFPLSPLSNLQEEGQQQQPHREIDLDWLDTTLTTSC